MIIGKWITIVNRITIGERDNYSKDRINIKGLWVKINGGLGAAPPTSFGLC